MRGNKEPRKPNWKTIGKTNVLSCVEFLTRVPDRYHLIDLEEFLSNDHNEPQKILQINFFSLLLTDCEFVWNFKAYFVLSVFFFMISILSFAWNVTKTSSLF